MKAHVRFTVMFMLWNLVFEAHGQTISGIPNITNFSKNAYNAGIQNWDIAQDNNGYIYFANNEGMLRFDGTFWMLYPFPNKLIVRSLAIGPENRIYAGGQNDFGYFSPDENGTLQFTSLKKFLSAADLAFEYILDIVVSGDDVFFRERDRIFHFNQDSVKVYKNEKGWLYLGLHQQSVIAQDGLNQLLTFTGSSWQPVAVKPLFSGNTLITAVIPYGKDSSLILTRKGKAYVLTHGKVLDFHFKGDNLAENLVLCAIAINDEQVAIGTDVGGCYIINKNGEVVQHISKKDGLQNNTVVSIFRDNRKNIWLGLDNGIDFIATSNAIKQVYAEKFDEGIGYSSIIHNNDLYIGTSKGLFKAPASGNVKDKNTNEVFRFVTNSTGSVWNLTEIEGKLLMANHVGAFVIRKDSAVPLNTTMGYWGFLPLRQNDSSTVIIAGGYKGLELYLLTQGSFTKLSTLPGFKTAARSMAIDSNQSVWIGTSFNGIVKVSFDINLNPVYKTYGTKSGLPSQLRNRICKVNGQIFSVTEKGIYQYNQQKDLFEESGLYNGFFRGRDIRLIKSDDRGNVWFIEGKNIGFLNIKDKINNPLYFPELDGKIVSGNSLEFIYPYKPYNVFVGSQKGFYQINYEEYKKNNSVPQVKIIAVKAIDKTDSLLFGGYKSSNTDSIAQTSVVRINSSLNSFHFEYSSPSYSHQLSIQYSFQLDGFDNDWSAWSANTQKDYTNLPPGTYIFRVKAKTSLGEKATADSFKFTVQPPWYRTWWAYLIYLVIFICLVYLLYKEKHRVLSQQQKKHEEEQQKIQYLHKLEMEISEKEIVALRNEKLKAELEGKNSELASLAMQMVHKGEVLSKVKDELVRLKKVSDEDGSGDSVRKLIRALKDEDKMDEDWKNFATHFDTIHSDFTKSLKLLYPNITHNEIKLSTYLHMNLSSKEISQLLNISVRGVEISRYRLRKKLQLSSDMNLNDFFKNFSSQKQGG
ncbi:ligand-binding sensor domain-containing protein [Flavitalea antarctica]